MWDSLPIFSYANFHSILIKLRLWFTYCLGFKQDSVRHSQKEIMPMTLLIEFFWNAMWNNLKKPISFPSTTGKSTSSLTSSGRIQLTEIRSINHNSCIKLLQYLVSCKSTATSFFRGPSLSPYPLSWGFIEVFTLGPSVHTMPTTIKSWYINGS